MNPPKVTIAVLNRNGIGRLEKTLPSILAQDFSSFEVLVLDNGSTDASKQYLKQHEMVRLLESDVNLGYGVAKNMLVKEARGEYILLLDNDIELRNLSTVQILHENAKKLHAPTLISPIVCDINKVSAPIGLSYTSASTTHDIGTIVGHGYKQIPAYRGNTLFVRRSTFLELGGFDEVYPFNIDDYDLSARAHLKMYQVMSDTDVIVYHHGIESRIDAMSLSWKYRYYFAGFSRMMVKNYKLHNLLLWLPISWLWITFKVVRTSLKAVSLTPVRAHLFSVSLFVRDLPSTLKLRRTVQGERIADLDLYLSARSKNISQKRIFKILRLFLFILVLSYVISKADLQSVWAGLREVQVGYLVASVAVSVVTVFIMSARLQTILSKQGVRVERWHNFLINYYSHFIDNFFVGFIGGDAYKLLTLPGGKKDILKCLVSDRAIGLVVLTLLALPGGVVYLISIDAWSYFGSIANFVMAVVLCVAIFLTALWYARNVLRRWWQKISVYLPAIFDWRVLSMTLLSQLLMVLNLYLVFWAIGWHIPLTLVLLYVPLINLVITLPISVKGYGFRELLIVYFFGVGISQVLIFTVVNTIVTIFHTSIGAAMHVIKK